MKDVLDLIARILISGFFLYDAYDSIFYFQDTQAKMVYYGLSWNEELLLLASIVLLIVGGILVLLGYRTTLGASLLLLYFIPLTFIVHNFWSVPDSYQLALPVQSPKDYQRLQGVLFMKNLAIIGGLLMVYVNQSRKYRIRRIFATFRVPGA
jgi:putative oxidoreductase